MAKIRCMYCAAEIADDAETCPACGATSHYRKAAGSSLRVKKFLIFFVLLVAACAFFIVWLPR